MANILITASCNLNCSYCFAKDYLTSQQGDNFLSLEAFERRLAFLKRSHIDEVRLIGGEPTLHPQFPRLVQMAAAAGKQIIIFSHGLIPERSLACLEALPPDKCTVLVNTNASSHPDGPTPAERARRLGVMRRLGQRARPGFNIYRPDFDLQPLLDLINDAGCKKTIRLGLAQPVVGGRSGVLSAGQYPSAGEKIGQFALRAAAQGVTLEFDCGFVRCMFSPASLEALQQAQAGVGWHCSPILDLDLHDQALHCFPLSEKARVSINEAEDAAGLRSLLTEKFAPYRQAGIYKECSTCAYKLAGECSGGCLAHTMRRFRTAHFSFALSNPGNSILY